jgi:hypothetical protein
MSTLPEFRRQLTEALVRRGLNVRTWTLGGRGSRNLLELTTAPNTTVLYMKEFNVPGKAGFWGLTRNQIDRLEKAAPRWFTVLLLRNVAAGYVLTSAQVHHCIADGSFELSRDGDFKVNEVLDLKPAQAFRALDALLDQIL